MHLKSEYSILINSDMFNTSLNISVNVYKVLNSD